jgi:CRP/FNR family transcriptional regulator
MRIVECERCAIRAKSVVADLPQDKLDAFRSCSVITLYRPRQVVFAEGGAASGLYVVCRGAVKVYQSDRFGRDHILGVAQPGDVLGELPLDARETCSVSAETLTDTQLCFLPRERLTDLLQLHPTIGMRLVAALSRALSAARRKVRALALKPAESRLAELLLQLANAGGSRSVVLGYSRREIAEMIGVSTETAIRLLARLRRKRAIAVDRRELVITNPERLRRLATRDSLADTGS